MSESSVDPAAMFDALIRVWQTGDPHHVLELVTPGYVGHMLHLDGPDRTAAAYPDWIARYRRDNPDVRFEVSDQATAGSHLWTRLCATRPDGSRAYGMNQSRFEGDRIAEEWAIWSAWRE